MGASQARPSSSQDEPREAAISAIDLFCGAGGLSQGLQEGGIPVVAGIDIDGTCAYAYESNIEAPFLPLDVRDVTAERLAALWTPGSLRLLAGCAPCQPFSPYRRGVDTSGEEQWPLLNEFGRLVYDTLPELVTMENVPRVGSAGVFRAFVQTLRETGYHVAWKSVYALEYGLPQQRRRLVLMASRLGEVQIPRGAVEVDHPVTVRDVIGHLPVVAAGSADPEDPLHAARRLSPLNLQRIRASREGGTWHDWPEELLAPCHTRPSGASFKNVYARMAWDAPAPTITTLAHNYGAGRFGHPEQDRPITLREAALLQGFPLKYKLLKEGERANFSSLGRLIGNAVPPPIARAVADGFVAHVKSMGVAGV